MFGCSSTLFSISIVLFYWKTVCSGRRHGQCWWHFGCIQVLRTRAIFHIHELVDVPGIRESLFVPFRVSMMWEMWLRGEVCLLPASLSFVSRGGRGTVWWVSLGKGTGWSHFFLFFCFSGSFPISSTSSTLQHQCILFHCWPDVCIRSASGTRETDSLLHSKVKNYQHFQS